MLLGEGIADVVDPASGGRCGPRPRSGPRGGVEREELPRRAAVDLYGLRLVTLVREDERRRLSVDHVERERRGAEITAVARDRRVAGRHADEHLVRRGSESGDGSSLWRCDR